MSPQENYWAAVLAFDMGFALWFVSALCWAAARQTIEHVEPPMPGFSEPTALELGREARYQGRTHY